MKDRDEIKDLFQQELGNYQMKVNPNLWNGVQAGITGAGAVGTAGASMSVLTKVLIGVGVAATVTVGAVLLTSKSEEKVSQEIVQTEDIQAENTVIEQENITEEKAVVESQKSTENPIISEEVTENTSNEIPEIIDDGVIHLSPITQIDGFITDNSSSKSPETIVSQNGPSTYAPEKPELVIDKVDLSNVSAKIQKQDNQYVDFIAENVPEGAEVTWNFGNGMYDYGLESEYFFENAGRHEVTLTVTADGQTVIRTVSVDIKINGFIGELPNVFTPNGDGKNDELYLETRGLKTFQLTVMDRSQKVVYSTNDPNFRWNGIDKGGNPVPVGEYVYIVVAEDEVGNKINKYQNLSIRR